MFKKKKMEVGGRVLITMEDLDEETTDPLYKV